tara:strand:+ start:2777 stop:2920 length:144 start_codon:yes stop_codon:yes gene_type:complete
MIILPKNFLLATLWQQYDIDVNNTFDIDVIFVVFALSISFPSLHRAL